MTDETYTTGTGQVLVNIHPERPDCREHGCVIHAPSDHYTSHLPTHWRDDRGLMERMCSHGVGHPDPDDLNFIRRTRGDKVASAEAVHGCDGCCMDPAEWIRLLEDFHAEPTDPTPMTGGVIMTTCPYCGETF